MSNSGTEYPYQVDPGDSNVLVHRKEQERRSFYITVRQKFFIATTFAMLWFGISLWLARPWIGDLTEVVGSVLAYSIILMIALLPGFLNAHILMSVLLDSPPPLPRQIMDHPEAFPPITVLIAAYNEEENLPETLMSLMQQDYPAPVEIIVADDGSTDETVSVLKALRIPNLTLLQVNHRGKAGALTAGLHAVTTDVTVCIDADTYLQPQALKRIVARLISDPSHTAAVAGCVLVRNSRSSFMTRLQEWDYFLGISSAKRQQALYQGTLVAQGAFSVFKTSALRQCEGWPAVIGEDIVLTWKLLSKGFRVGYEASALCFTNAPTDLSGFWRQRQRWARGMIEGLKRYGNLVWHGNLTGFFVGVDFVIPIIDLFYSAVFLPGVILALTGRYYIVGPMTLLVIPVAFMVVTVMFHKQRQVFEELNLKVRKNSVGFLIFMLLYQPLMSPICLTGYLKELAGARKRW
ncbi:MAG TPA: glycosyltransferase family 2 protein [Terriglobia bacterium]|nr:glycosyltransferase family 2 protein [Terriglobia bacterium]